MGIVEGRRQSKCESSRPTSLPPVTHQFAQTLKPESPSFCIEFVFAFGVIPFFPEITLYSFTGGNDGYNLFGGVVFDSKGNLYGTNFFGGQFGEGTVFQLTPGSTGWAFKTLYSFGDTSTDVGHSYAHVTLDSSGNLYGTASTGGSISCGGDGCGGIFRLTQSTEWKESVVFDFTATSGGSPFAGLSLHNGSFYGMNEFGPFSKNNVGDGMMFKLTPNGSNQWKETTVHTFHGGVDGYEPASDLVFDQEGNAYGSTQYGGTYQQGDIFELSPSGKEHWREKILFSTHGVPSTLIVDSAGNLYGADDGGLANCDNTTCGEVFELQRTATGWQEITMYQFTDVTDGFAPAAGLVSDSKGNLYGTTSFGGTGTCIFFSFNGCGTVFKLTPANGGWQKTTLYNFTGDVDGEFPGYGSLVLDSSDNLYGTTLGGYTYGSSGYGSVYEIQQ